MKCLYSNGFIKLDRLLVKIFELYLKTFEVMFVGTIYVVIDFVFYL